MEPTAIGTTACERGETGTQHCCSYCRFIFTDGQANREREIWNTVLFETENFLVVPTLGALVEGWLLIISRDHHLCTGAMPASLHMELETVVCEVSSLVDDAYGSPTIFEHGPCRAGDPIGCGIDHAHLHVVPLAFSLVDAIRNAPDFGGMHWSSQRGDLSQLRGLHSSGKAYVYVKQPDGLTTYCTPPSLPCQSVRKVIARQLGMPNKYDYRSHPHATNVKRTVERLMGNLAEGKVHPLIEQA